MLKHLYVLRFLIALVAAVAAAGCSDDPAMPDGGSQPGIVAHRNLYIRLHLNLAESGIPDPLSRAGEASEPLKTPGTSRENAIVSMDLLVCEADAAETVIDMVSLVSTQIDMILANETLGVNIDVPTGHPVHIYLLANIPEKLRQAFVAGQSAREASFATRDSEYWDIINEIVPGSDASQETLESRTAGSIPMTGQFRLDPAVGTDPTDIIVPADNSKENPMILAADLCRMVAKSHVLVRSLIPSNNIEYVYAIDSVAAAAAVEEPGSQITIDSKWLGWIRKDNVRYIPNGINKSTYILPHPTDRTAYGWADLNMDLGAYLIGGIARDLDFNAPMWGRDFAFYNNIDLHRENIAADTHFAPVETFDPTKYGNTIDGSDSPDRYTRGMYCTENYFIEPTGDTGTRFATHNDALPVVTQVTIAAKLVPRWIVVLEDFKAGMDAFVMEYINNAADFYDKYGLTRSDFNQADVDRWNAMKNNPYYKEYLESPQYVFRNTFRILQLGSEQDAMDILSWSIMRFNLWSDDPADFEHGKYPDGTYFAYDLKYDAAMADQTGGLIWTQHYLYLCAGAVAGATEDNADIKTYSVPHLGGWGYYYTYLNATDAPLVNRRVPYNASQVTRNTYYLVTVSNFGTPGGTITRPEYIKVNTAPVNWTYAARGDINLY